MAIYTDSVEFASPYLPPAAAGRLCSVRDPEPSIQPVLDGIFGASAEIFGAAAPESRWAEILLTPFSPRSQFNVLVGMARSGAALPDRVACLAGSGLEFHGFKGRSWEASEGNVHLSVHLAPERPVERFEVAFTILAAVAVVEALDGIPGLAACPRIRWVNDILLGQGKVAGVLAYSKTLRNHVSSVVLGIGVNVETTPSVRPTPFVPSVTSVREFLPADAPDARVTVLTRLLAALDDNYRLLLTEGYRPLLERYRERSVVVGREVTVCTEESDETATITAGGRVVTLGDGLELHLEGHPRPVTRGRVIVGKAEAAPISRAPVPSRRPHAPHAPEEGSRT